MSDYSTGENLVNGDAVVSDGENGTAYYAWNAEDTANAGSFKAEFEVTYTDGSIETFPNDGYITIEIDPDLG